MTGDNRAAPRAIFLALIVGAFFTAEEVFMDLARGRTELTTSDVVNGIEFWVVWALLVPLATAAARRWRYPQRVAPGITAIHVCVGLALATLHNLVVIAVQVAGSHLTGHPVTRWSAVGGANPTAFVWGVFTGMIFYASIIVTFRWSHLQELYIAEQVSLAALSTELSEAKLDTLRSQLRPHFLFNTLNAISVIADEDVVAARQMILRLSTLLRRSFDEAAHEVTLEKELAFLNDYLDIQRTRFGEGLRVDLAVAQETLVARVPVFLLQPLVENAIEHGTSDHGPTCVSLAATRDADDLRIAIIDNGPGLSPGPVSEGIGLGNTQARLRQLYGDRASVSLGAAPIRGVRVDIRLPFSPAPA